VAEENLFGLLVRQIAERPAPEPGPAARVLAAIMHTGQRYLLARSPMLDARSYIQPKDVLAFDDATMAVESGVGALLAGAYVGGPAPASDLIALRSAIEPAERGAFQAALIVGRSLRALPPSRGLLGSLGSFSLPGAQRELLQLGAVLVATRRVVERELQTLSPEAAPSYHAAMQRQYRRRRAAKAKRVRLDIYPEDERLLAALGFLPSDAADTPAALSDAIEVFLLASFLLYGTEAPAPERLAAQRKRMEALGVPVVGRGDNGRKKRTQREK
jgi:hypothetical protein